MPYIQCPDGNVYSRYDQSPYVVECIKNESHRSDSLFNACTQDPRCFAERQRQQHMVDIFMGTIFVLTLILGLLGIISIWKSK